MVLRNYMSEFQLPFESRQLIRSIRSDNNFDEVLETIRNSSKEELCSNCPATDASLLFYAVQRSNDSEAHELCQVLCDELKVCDPTHLDRNQQTALFFAARDGHLECVRYLIAHGCAPDHRDSVAQTALFYAARDGRDDVVKLLLDHGANINNADRLGQTALFYGARDGRTSTVALMLSRGASINICDRHRRTASYYALRNNHHEILAILKSSSENPKSPVNKAKASTGKDTLDYIAVAPHSENQDSSIDEEIKKSSELARPQKRTRNGLSWSGSDSCVTRETIPEELQPVRRRCYRLCMRGPDAIGEELRWLSAPLEQVKIFESLLPSIAVWPRDAPCPVSDILMNTRAFWQPIALSIIDELAQSKEGWIFLKPVDCKAWKCPDYYEVIKYPMDFMTMRKKFKLQVYIRCQDFVNDLELIFSNCFRYNRPESNVAFFGRSIQAQYQTLASEKGIARWVALENELEQWYYSLRRSQEESSKEVPVANSSNDYVNTTSVAANAG